MQKLIKIILIIPFLFLACVNQKTEAENKNCVTFDSGFTICRDTIFVDIKGGMRNAFKHNGRFYTIFEERNFSQYGGRARRWMYVFSNNGIEKIVDIPQRMNAVYWDFFVKNDSIILKQYMSDVHFYFNTQNFTWEEISEVDDLIFEDDRFYVFSLDFGQWGGTTWFRDKKTGLEYIVDAIAPLINKIDTVYYLTNSFSVLRIENPLLLNKAAVENTYENIVARGRMINFWLDGSAGFEVVYEKAVADYFEFSPQSHIVSSFVWQNELFHIYQTDTATYIAKIENSSMKPIQKIAEDLRFFLRFESYRRRNLDGKNELLMFRTNDEQVFGLMNIVGSNIHLRYFVNKARLVPTSIGAEKADSIFVNRLNLILSDLGTLQLSTVDSIEQSWGTFANAPNFVNNSKSYFIQEDSLITNTIMYYATKKTDLVSVVSMNWHRNFNVRRWFPDYEKILNEAFQEKLSFLENHLTQEFGEPTEVVSQMDWHLTRIWKTPNGFTIRLVNSTRIYNFIRMTIHRD